MVRVTDVPAAAVPGEIPVRRTSQGLGTTIRRTVRIAWELTRLDLVRRYTPSLLGMLWGIVSPLCMAGIIGTVFGKLFSVSLREFLPYLFLNLTMWGFVTASADSGTISFLAAEGYIKQIPTVSLFAYPLRMVLGAFITLLLAFVSVVLVVIALGRPITPAWLCVIPGLVAWLFFGFGMACITGVINTAMRDFQHVQSLILQALFYATPIIYPIHLLVDHGAQWLLTWNPLYHLLMLVQIPLLQGEVPSSGHVVASLLSLTIILGIATVAVRFARSRLVFWL